MMNKGKEWGVGVDVYLNCCNYGTELEHSATPPWQLHPSTLL